MTEYNFSPAAYEQHLAKQARVAEWSAESSQQAHEYSNPFKPTPEELAKKSQTEFYTSDGLDCVPDRPPSPGSYPMAPPRSKPQAGWYPSGNATPPHTPQQAPVPTVVPAGTRVYVPRFNGKAWVYEEVRPTPQRKGSSTSASVKSGSIRPSPKRSQTMPVACAAPGSAQQHYYYQAQPHSGSSATTAASGSTGYTYPMVMVDGAPPKRPGNKLKKKSVGDGKH